MSLSANLKTFFRQAVWALGFNPVGGLEIARATIADISNPTENERKFEARFPAFIFSATHPLSHAEISIAPLKNDQTSPDVRIRLHDDQSYFCNKDVGDIWRKEGGGKAETISPGLNAALNTLYNETMRIIEDERALQLDDTLRQPSTTTNKRTLD